MKALQLAVFALLLFAAACAAPAEQTLPLPPQDVVVSRPDVTRIYFVRDEGKLMQPRPIRVLDAEREIGLLTQDTFLCWERTPGRTIARAFYESLDPSRGKLEGIKDLDCAAGRAYFFNVTVRDDDGTPVIVELDEAEGRRLVAERKPAGG